MKKKLLLFGAVLLLSVASFAQGWVAPTFTPQEFVVSTEGSDTTFFYLYNVEAKAFFCAGNAWGTQASLGTPPQKCFFTQNEDGTYYLWTWVPKNNMWDRLFIDNDTQMFIDCYDSAQGTYREANCFWAINFLEGNIFRIYGAETNESYSQLYYTETSFMGYDWYEGASMTGGLTPFLDIEEAFDDHQYMVDWMLVAPDDYDAIADKVAAYNSAMALQADLQDAEDIYTEINLAGIKAVYNNTNSTAAELDSVRTTLAAAMKLVDYIYEELYNYEISADDAFALLGQASFTADEVNAMYDDLYEKARLQEIYEVLDGASADDPHDGTSLLKNPAFEDGNIDGWTLTITTVTNQGFQGASYTNGDVTISRFCEMWRNGGPLGDGEISQTLKALPAGKYSFSVDAIAVNQNGANPCSGVELFAKGGSIEVVQAIATGNNAPEHYEISFVSDGGDITLGVRTLSATANWVAVDNFELWFYGEFTGDPYQEILLDYVAQLEEKYADLDYVFAQTEAKEAFVDGLETAKNATSDFEAAKATLEGIVADLEASISDYQKFASAMEYADNRRLEFEDAWPDLSGLIGDLLEFGSEGISEEGWNEMYENGTADSTLCNDARNIIEDVIANYISENLKPGDFVTPLIKNPDFKTGFDSWSNTGARPGFGGVGGNGDNLVGEVARLESGNAEVFHNAFDMFQVIKNMPKGSFTLTCQAFERNESNDWASDYLSGVPNAGINAYLYANEFQTKVCNYAAFAQPEEVYHSSNEDWESDVYNEILDAYLPNSMDGANFFFDISPETYLVKVNFTLAEAGQDITIGLANPATNSWVIFDNFNLVYNGDDASAYADAISDLVKNLENAVPEDAYCSTVAKKMVDDAIISLLSAASSDDVNKCVEAIKAGTDALAYATASVSSYAAVEKAYDNLSDALVQYEETAHEEAIAAANEALKDADAVFSTLDSSNEELAELVQKLKDCTEALKPFVYDVDLTVEDFCSWDQPEAGAIKQAQAGCAYDVGISTGMPYGDGNVYYLNFADLSQATRLTIVATEGQPRCLFNRIVDQGTVQVEVPRDADYWTITDNGDGSKTYVVDIARIVEEYGYCHLHAIKGANWQNTTVLSMKVGYGENNLPDAINVVETAKQAANNNTIYNLAGQKLTAPQKGVNIINGKKIFIK